MRRNQEHDPAEDELKSFLSFDRIKCFEDIDESCTPEGFCFKRGENYVVFYEMVCKDELAGVPTVSAAIRVDSDVHVKLFSEGNPVPHPQWFRKNNNVDCKLASKGSLINFVNHIHSSAKISLLDELLRIQNYQKKGFFSGSNSQKVEF